MTDATRTLISAATADIRLNTRGLGAFLEEVLVDNGDWTVAYAASGSNTMLQCPAGMGTCYMHILDQTGYAEIQIGSGASNVSTLTGKLAPPSTKSYFRKNDNGEGNTIAGAAYVGPNGDFLLFNAFGATSGETSSLAVGNGLLFNPTDANGFFVAGATSSGNSSSNQNALQLRNTTNGRNWLDSKDADNSGEILRLCTTDEQSFLSDGPISGAYPGVTDGYLPLMITIGDQSAGELRGYLHGAISLNHNKPHQAVRNNDFASGQHDIVMPAGSIFGAAQKAVSFDVFEVSGTSGTVYITTDAALWPQAA